jgi:16S rRNA (guanine1207-N2)-methyltransferase
VKNTLIVERVRDIELRLETRPGIFAQYRIDSGTRLLIEAMRVTPTARVLDLGCGYGPIGIVAARLALRGSALLVDSDIRATRLAQRNLELNDVTNAEVILGDAWHDLPAKSHFDLVVSNPPTHSGREVLDDFVEGAYRVLRPRGQMYMVVNRLLSLRRQVEQVFGAVETVAQSKGFVVIRAAKVPRLRDDEAFDV